VNLAFAMVTPLGALLFFLGAGHLAHSHPAWVGAALAFCAGTFLCIACADLLPELQFHSHDRIKLSAALLAGIGVAVLIARFGHGHHEPEKHHDQTPVSRPAPDNGAEAAVFATPKTSTKAATHRSLASYPRL
jgi:zinc and cadmium transporter